MTSEDESPEEAAVPVNNDGEEVEPPVRVGNEESDLFLDTFVRESRVREIGPSLELRQEKTRQWLSLLLLGIFAAVILLPLAFIYVDKWNDTKEWFQSALPAIAGLLGSAMGFYFGARNNSGNS